LLFGVESTFTKIFSIKFADFVIRIENTNVVINNIHICINIIRLSFLDIRIKRLLSASIRLLELLSIICI
jgi:hypothetical protein